MHTKRLNNCHRRHTNTETETVQLHETMTVKKNQSNEANSNKIQRIIQYFNLGLHRKIHSTHTSTVCESNFMGIRERIKQKK